MRQSKGEMMCKMKCLSLCLEIFIFILHLFQHIIAWLYKNRMSEEIYFFLKKPGH